MKLQELYEPIRQVIEKMNLVDVKIYPGPDGEVREVLLKYVPVQECEAIACVMHKGTFGTEESDGKI